MTEVHRRPHYCVVFNTDGLPISFIPLRRALRLVLAGKVEPLGATTTWRSVERTFEIPRKVRLKTYKKLGRGYMSHAILNQRHLFERDGYVCQYCQRHVLDLLPRETLTRDHVVPRSKSGKDIWTNVVTACTTCNHRKCNRELSEVGFTLAAQPYAPTVAELAMKRSTKYERLEIA